MKTKYKKIKAQEVTSITVAKNRLEKLKNMYDFLKDKPRSKTTVAKLKKEINYYEVQIDRLIDLKKHIRTIEAIKKQSRKEMFLHKKVNTDAEPTHKVIEVDGDDKPLFEGSKRECEAYIAGTGLITLTIENL